MILLTVTPLPVREVSLNFHVNRGIGTLKSNFFHRDRLHGHNPAQLHAEQGRISSEANYMTDATNLELIIQSGYYTGDTASLERDSTINDQTGQEHHGDKLTINDAYRTG